jgi:hypothetical protein
MLLRFKDEYQLITREYDLLKYENEQLKKHIMDYVRQESVSFSKNRAPPEIKYIKKGECSNGKKNANGFTAKTKNIYYDCEDDNVSLSLSEQSTDQF